ncbi:hypothetical protein JG687_00017684 [Phytophthora cactorum]|uniref:Uncharacterized protein n=1 Tax=Phytophthora cactorum TaxID=29920 RepID=A0A8T1TQZ0_9STRA|nr:hypothetical protein JG687_00017684 [Phytophthora cactorum]
MDDVDHRTGLYYARYRCSGPHGKRAFSTIDDDYLAFPYLLTHQTGVSRDLFALVYYSMQQRKGFLELAAMLIVDDNICFISYWLWQMLQLKSAEREIQPTRLLCLSQWSSI